MVNYRNPSQYDLVFIDSSAIDAIRADNDLNKFFETKHMVFRSNSLEQEINHENTPDKTKQPFKGINWFTSDTPLNNQEEKIKEGIIKIMQGDAISSDKHLNDALHIFDAAKWEGYFIAVDKRIIKKRDLISKFLFNEQFGTFKFIDTRFIFTPTEFVNISKKNGN